ncbi:MAG: flagellar hook-associated protein FlgK [Burkholderiales bacterium]|nr:flagellar hook-associated protein FlgK [Burkholderiales bacterium]
MSTGIFSIGNTALNAAYTGLRTTGNNIANVNTPGYTRQTLVMVPQVGAFLGGSYLGQGVAVADVRRVYNDFLTSQAHQAQAVSSAADTRYLQLTQVANLFADPTTGIGANIDAFFNAVQDLTQRPGDVSVRQAVISAGNLLAQRFNDVGGRLQEFRETTERQLRLEADSVNRLASEVADLNNKIALARGSGRQPNDLLDRRDNATRMLNASVRVSAVPQDDGSLNLFLGNGQPLVVGARASVMDLTFDPIDPQNTRIGVRDGNTVIPLDAERVGGGRIAGLLQFATDDLPQVENELGRLANVITSKFNEQHRLGNDRNGNPGGDFFRPLKPQAFGAQTNTGTGTVAVTVADATQLQASDYRVDFGAGNYNLTRVSDGQRWTSATPTFNQDGLNITLAGTPASGDIFTLQAVRNGSLTFGMALAQVSEVAAANPVQFTVPTTNLGSLVVDDLSVVGPARNPNLTQSVTIDFLSATQYTITAGGVTGPGQTYSSGTPIDFNGWRLTVRGTPAVGDRLSLGANVGGVGDNRNALKLAQLVNTPLVDGGRLAGAFAGVVARVGADAQSAQVFNEAQETLLTDALDAESAVAGVNLDEEASRLMMYQQQYQAAAKVIATAGRIFEEILSIGR